MSTSHASPHPSSDAQRPVLSVTSPADILSYVPHALGFTPVESLVVLTTGRGRLGATLRVDLPSADPLPDGEATDFARAVLSFIDGDDEADGVLLIVYTHALRTPDGPPPHGVLVGELSDVLAVAGLPVRSGWLVSAAGWRDYFCDDGRCCPWSGHPLDTVTDSRLNAELIFGGSSFDGSPAEAVGRSTPVVVRPTPSPSRDAVEEGQAHYAAACAGHWDEERQFTATSDVWDAVIQGSGAPVEESLLGSGSDLDADLAGFLLASLESRAVRDFLLVSACLGSATALEGAVSCGVIAPATVHPGCAPGDGGQCVVPLLAAGWGVPRSGGPEDVRLAAPLLNRSAGGRTAADPAALRRFTDVLAGLHPGTPDWERVDAMTRVLTRLVAVAGPAGEARAAALTMLGWFDYARGRGSRAAVLFEAAEAALPGYRLARLLNELLCRGGLPAWARHRSTAWRSSTSASASAPASRAPGASQAGGASSAASSPVAPKQASTGRRQSSRDAA